MEGVCETQASSSKSLVTKEFYFWQILDRAWLGVCSVISNRMRHHSEMPLGGFQKTGEKNRVGANSPENI